jgi:hypothetical protein
MIEAHELRIGSLVYKGDESTPFKVMALLYSEVKLCDATVATPAQSAHHPNAKYSELRPIPLTPEILEKCGFDENCSYYKKDNVEIVKIYDSKIGDHYHFCPDKTISFGYFQYIHQLQNLYFALTGEELNVQL